MSDAGAANWMDFATIWERIADTIPDWPAVQQGDRIISWGDHDQRSARLAGVLGEAGLGPNAKVGLYLYNCPEYLEGQFAALKMRAVPINVNYRYLDDELAYLLDNADCEALVYHSSLRERVAAVRERLPDVRVCIEVDDRSDPVEGEVLDGSIEYEAALAGAAPAERVERFPDDLYMFYTGGTTGMPKGVMYGLRDRTLLFAQPACDVVGRPLYTSLDDVADQARTIEASGTPRVYLPCAPLMHGTGLWLGAMVPMLAAGTCVLLESRSLDVAEVWDVVERAGVNGLVIVGDAFARPLLRELDERVAAGHPADVSSLQLVVSSGAMFSAELKDRLVDYAPAALILDVLGSTEGGMGQMVSAKGAPADTATFQLNEGCKVIDDDDEDVVPGSGQVGMVALTSVDIPLGYYKDPEKSARTFRTIGDQRYVIPGDMATVAADGTVTLLGRGSNVINSAGEKIYPEEVEEAVKTHPAVADCLVFAVDDDRFGQRVAGIASLDVADGTEVTAEDIIAHTKTVLAGYKTPRELTLVDEVPRAPNGKADYEQARKLHGT